MRCVSLGLALLAWAALPALAEPSADDVIYQSPDLKIYRTLDPQGNPTLVLTNVDASGNFFPGRQSDPGGLPGGTGDAAPAAPPAARTEPAPAAVRVTLNDGDGGERPAGEGEVVVRTDQEGGTTIIININNNPPPPAAAAPTLVYPVLAFGGLPGPFRYPDHQHFLGYGHGTGSPSLFSGLGLNASNRFGLKTGIPCGRGYDCLFGPEGDHP